MRSLAVLTMLAACPVAAHPHLFIDAGLTLHVENGTLDHVVVTWEYDEFSTMLMIEDAGLDADNDMIPDTDRLAAFAGRDVDWAAGFPGDLVIGMDGRTLALGPAGNFEMRFENGRLISRHTRPVGQKLSGEITAQLYDASYFVAYTVSLPVQVKGDADCAINRQPADLDAAYTLVEELLYGPRSEEFNEDNYPAVGAHFADTLTVTCAGSS